MAANTDHGLCFIVDLNIFRCAFGEILDSSDRMPYTVRENFAHNLQCWVVVVILFLPLFKGCSTPITSLFLLLYLVPGNIVLIIFMKSANGYIKLH